MAKNSIVDSVWDLAEPIAKQLKLEIFDIKFLKEGSDWILRIFIDKENGVNITDCEKFSRAIDEPLDKLDPISMGYSLEVSSPGIERELTRDWHFKRYIGEKVFARLIRPEKKYNRKEIRGILKEATKENIIIFCDEEFIIDRKNIAFIKLDDFIN